MHMKLKIGISNQSKLVELGNMACAKRMKRGNKTKRIIIQAIISGRVFNKVIIWFRTCENDSESWLKLTLTINNHTLVKKKKKRKPPHKRYDMKSDFMYSYLCDITFIFCLITWSLLLWLLYHSTEEPHSFTEVYMIYLLTPSH